MSSHVAHYFAAVVLILSHSRIVSVKGQCTVHGCENGDPLTSIVEEIQQMRVELFDHVNKQVQNIQNLLIASFQQMTRSLQAVDRRPEEHDICIKQVQSIHEILNESVQQQQNQHDTVMNSLLQVDRRSQENNVYIKGVPSIHALLNQSFQEMKSQHGTVNMSLQAVDRRLQNYQIDIKNQTQKSWKLVNDICGPASLVRDCSDIKAGGQTTSGVYEVCVGNQPDRVCTKAFCDMKTANSTSLVFQRRKDGSVNFNRTWAEYKQGFGNPIGEFWLGNEMLYLLTSTRNYKLRVDLEDFLGNKSFAEYTRFYIGSLADNYRLTVGGYSGNAGDSLNHNNGKQFNTIDVDNDDYYSRNCARYHGGAWWHGSCTNSNLNGIYHQRYDTVNGNTGIFWYHWHNSYTSLKATEMKLVPVA